METVLLYWNGIKDAKGAKLQMAWYSDNSDDGAITIYARHYRSFSARVRAAFTVTNDTDTMSDYFADDTIRVLPTHPLYAQVKAAADAANAHDAKRDAKRADKSFIRE